MSLILDALKKLDREKKSSPGSGGVNIAAGILRPDSARPGRRVLMYFAAAALAAFAAAAVTYSVVGRPVHSPLPSPMPAPALSPSPPHPSPPQPAAAAAPQAESAAKSSPALPASPSAPNPQSASLSTSREPVRETQGKSGGEPRQPSRPGEARSALATPIEKGAVRQASLNETKSPQKAAGKTAEPAPKETAAAPPSLKLSGILWYENASQRRALINGMALPEGAVIEGVKVLEIHPTRVRLSHNGRPYDIPMPQ